MSDVLEALGALCVVAGLALVALPAALVVAGVFLLYLAYSLEPTRARR